MRVKATISYDGSKFLGFQKQKDYTNTVATQIELALESLNINPKIYGSGRTDKGVHAIGQVIHFDLPIFWEKKNLNDLKRALNFKLNHIRFDKIEKASKNFHAQYDAKIRVYRYILKEKPTIFEKDFVSQEKIENLNLFKQAIKTLEGKHNFKYFKKEGSVTSSDIREIYKTKVFKLKKYTIVYFFANGYLRSQVRLMIASALSVANSEITLENLKEQLTNQKRYITKPADGRGLYLFRVYYE